MEHENAEFTDFERIHSWLSRLNEKGTMNLLFSDGLHLVAYRDSGGHKCLSFTRREAPYGRVELTDEDWSIDLSQEKGPQQRGYIVATNPLTEEVWQAYRRGQMIVFRDGEIVYDHTP
jgi:predicted glutamine amidotransferase